MKILYNARIYTLDPALENVSALAVERGEIVAAGDTADLLIRFGNAERQDLESRIVIPGLTDAHIHLETYALFLQKVDCETPTRQDCLRRVAERADQTPEGEWILGHGWNQNEWPEGFGSAADLDAITTRHPVYLTAKSLHAGWANSTALRMAGIGEGSPDPPGGRLGRDERGVPNGILFEGAMELVEGVIPAPSSSQSAEAIRKALPVLWSMGLTGVHDFDRRNCFSALQILEQRGELRLRVVKSIPIESLTEAAELGLRSHFGSDWLRIGNVKAFADGALGPQTAAMLQPYEGSSERGMLLIDAEELFEQGRVAVENGLGLAVHAIGDRANHEVLNAFAQLRAYEKEKGLPPARHRIEHVQLLHADDASRLAELQITASMQPIHATSDMNIANQYWGERAALSYAWRTQLRYGARLAFGSDAPVESPNPFWGLHAAVTRRRADGSPGPKGWYPEQRLSALEALQAFTTGPAYAAGMENRLGRLAPGYLADLVVLETDPFNCDPQEIYHIRPRATMVGGEWVYQQN